MRTAHRQRTNRRNKLAEEIRTSWIAPDAGILHWDGKALKIRRGETGNYIAIYLSGVEDKVPSTLLGVPRAPGGTGKEEFEVIKMTLEESMVEGVKVLGLVFDNTLNNTGEWEGVCRYLQFRGVHYCTVLTLSQSCLKVHGGVPLALCISLDPLVLRVNCLVIRELLNVLFLNPESSILKP